MRRLLGFLLALTLLLQVNWAVAAAYCGHEASSAAAAHFGHHAHVHQAAPADVKKAGDGAQPAGGSLAPDDDCTFCHAAHPAIVPPLATPIGLARPVATGFPEPARGTSAPPRAPDRPQWPRLA